MGILPVDAAIASASPASMPARTISFDVDIVAYFGVVVIAGGCA
jgi:hypothetical protein